MIKEALQNGMDVIIKGLQNHARWKMKKRLQRDNELHHFAQRGQLGKPTKICAVEQSVDSQTDRFYFTDRFAFYH